MDFITFVTIYFYRVGTQNTDDNLEDVPLDRTNEKSLNSKFHIRSLKKNDLNKNTDLGKQQYCLETNNRTTVFIKKQFFIIQYNGF